MNRFYSDVYAIVEQIPYGKVMSYGQIACALGRPRSAREVGRAMRHCPEHLPWQRVVMRDGTVTGGMYADIRKAMLESEGVPFLPDGRVDMLACNYEMGNKAVNIFDLPKLPLSEELTTSLHESGNVRIERIISTGQVTDWYDQTETEFVALLEGNATIEFESGKTVTMSKGDTLLIAPHERHRVSFTSTEPPCLWLCVFWK